MTKHKTKKKAKAGSSSAAGRQDLQDAMAALKEAQGSIDLLRRAKDEAAAQVLQASGAVADAQRTEGGEGGPGSYGEEQYWEQRYRRDASVLAPSDEEILYEWYLPYSALAGLIRPELERRGGFHSRVLVPGCGNSSLCEDLATDGFDRISGMDYSPTVIETMGNRSECSPKFREKVRYFCADARDMAAEPDGAYDAVVDKGTLDAIMSDSSDGAGLRSATQYLQEMWRVLCKSRGSPIGCLLLLTTMNPPVLSQLLDAAASSSGRDTAHMWDLEGSNMAMLKTSEGRDIFFYSFPCNLNYSIPIRNDIPKTGIPSGSLNGDDISLEIDRIRREAADAIASLRLAQSEVERSQKWKSDTEKSLNDTTQKVDQLKETIDQSWSTMSDGLASGDASSMPPDPTRPEAAAAVPPPAPNMDKKNGASVNWRDEEIFERVVPPPASVKLDVAEIDKYSNVSNSCHRSVTVSYTLEQSAATPSDSSGLFECWDEDDMIALEVVAGPAAARDLSYVYPKEDVQPYESFEYTENPSQIDDSFRAVGSVQFPLPPYGGWFVFSYVRQVVEITESASQTYDSQNPDQKQNKFTVLRKRIRLAHTEPFFLVCSVFPCRPNTLLLRGRSVRRRGGGQIQYVSGTPVRSLRKTDGTQSTGVVFGKPVLEFMRSLEYSSTSVLRISIACTAALQNLSEKVCVTRLLAWGYKEDSSSESTLSLVVEADVIVLCEQTGDMIKKKTHYWLVPIDNIDIADTARGFGTVDTSGCTMQFLIPLASQQMLTARAPEEEGNICLKDSNSVFCTFCGDSLIAKLEKGSSDQCHKPKLCEGRTLPPQPLGAIFYESENYQVLVSEEGIPGIVYGKCNVLRLYYPSLGCMPSSIGTSSSTTVADSVELHELTCSRCWSVLGDAEVYCEGESCVLLNGHAVTIASSPTPRGIMSTHPYCNVSAALREICSRFDSSLVSCVLRVRDSEELNVQLDVLDLDYSVVLTDEDISFILGATYGGGGGGGGGGARCRGVSVRCTEESHVEQNKNDAASVVVVLLSYSEFAKIRESIENAARCISPDQPLVNPGFTSFILDI